QQQQQENSPKGSMANPWAPKKAVLGITQAVGILAHKDPKTLARIIHNAKYHPSNDLDFRCGHKHISCREAPRQTAEHEQLLYWTSVLIKGQSGDNFDDAPCSPQVFNAFLLKALEMLDRVADRCLLIHQLPILEDARLYLYVIKSVALALSRRPELFESENAKKVFFTQFDVVLTKIASVLRLKAATKSRANKVNMERLIMRHTRLTRKSFQKDDDFTRRPWSQFLRQGAPGMVKRPTQDSMLAVSQSSLQIIPFGGARLLMKWQQSVGQIYKELDKKRVGQESRFRPAYVAGRPNRHIGPHGEVRDIKPVILPGKIFKRRYKSGRRPVEKRMGQDIQTVSKRLAFCRKRTMPLAGLLAQRFCTLNYKRWKE
ncbi:hypothetical protein LTS18_007302, partial [Coniosporium uncinatum]